MKKNKDFRDVSKNKRPELNEWKEVKLSEVSSKIMYGMNAAAIPFDGKHKYIRITDIDERTKQYSPSPITSPAGKIEEKYKVNSGDILFARTGASAGKSYIYNENDGNLYFAGFLIRFSITAANSKFIFYTTLLPKYRSWVAAVSVRSGQPGINAEEYASLNISLPGAQEQSRIVQVLETWDKAIELLGKKIKTKKQIKRGLMQELLTGEKRVPGFKATWKDVRLGQICEIISGGTPSTQNPNYWNGDIEWITPTEITKLKGRYLNTSMRKITELGLRNSSATLVRENSLILCSRASVGLCAINQRQVTTNQGFKNIVPHPDQLDVHFIYYWALMNQEYFYNIASGSTFMEFSKKDLSKAKINLPSLPEQTAIAKILTTADDEIEALGKKKLLLEDQKTFLLNNLVTGKIRTPENLTANV